MGLTDARSVADRLALIRSLVRLRDGRVVLAEESLQLSGQELVALSRFGLALTGQDKAIRLADEVDAGLPRDYLQADRLDAVQRTIFESATADAALLRYSAHGAYRSAAQKSAVRALLTMPDGAGLMVSMPTGSGKSLLFQLSTLFWRCRVPGVCSVVITPTVALAHDHERTLSQISGLEGSRALTGDVVGEARVDLLSAFRRGEVPILFFSPELAFGEARAALLEAATLLGEKYAGLSVHLRALFLDEAHIVESWGRSFRPDFQRLPALLGELRQANPMLRMVLLSATISPPAREELRRAYGRSGAWLEIDARTPRYDLDVVVEAYDTADARLTALDNVIDRAPRPAIVYTTRVEDAGMLHRRLQRRGYERVKLYTGEITDPSARRRIVEDWAGDNLDLLVATSAFGLGVDKADVRSVIHACLPEGPVRWYQEIGRASRDGHQGLAACLFTNSRTERDDVHDAFGQATASWLTREIAESRWRALLERRVSSRWIGARRRLTLDLDATREGLPSQSSDYNRTWNMSLLNLMQRAGILAIIAVATQFDEMGARWDVEVIDDGLLEPGAQAIWDRIFAIRNAEQAVAREDLKAFVQLMTKSTEQCLTRAVFDLVEQDPASDAPPCGRCPGCRALGVPPPNRLPCHGLERACTIGRTPPSMLPQGSFLVVPEDAALAEGLASLLHRLAAAGVEQFLVPDALAYQAAQILTVSPVHLGLVLGHGEWVDPPAESLVRLPTALLLPLDETAAAALLQRSRQFLAAAPGTPMAIVGRPEMRIDQRRLDQTVSNHAPYAEEVLDHLAARRPEVA
jgi:ATP-dependent DNA helicase RecQ